MSLPHRPTRRSRRDLCARSIPTALAIALLAAIFSIFSLGSSSAPQADAARANTRVEIPSLRTSSSRTYSNPDGSRTAELFAAPIHYRDDSGDWQPISSRLIREDRDGYAWRSEANRFHARFRERSNPTTLLRVDVNGHRLSTQLEGAASVVGTLGESNIAYEGILPEVDLRYDILPHGVKETLTLRSRAARSHFEFTLSDSSALSARERPDGSWAVSDPAGSTLVTIEPPFVVEANGAVSTAAVTLQMVEVANRVAITLSVDPVWLAHRERQFPIAIDPTLIVDKTVDDATIFPQCPTCTPVRSDRVSVGGTTQAAGNVLRAAVKFDMAAVPLDATIISADLAFHFDGVCLSSGCGSSHQFDVHEITEPWQTSPSPAIDPLVLSSVAFSGGPPHWLHWDVLDAIQEFAYEEWVNNGFMVVRAPEAEGVGGPSLPGGRHSDPSIRPILTVEYEEDQPIPLFVMPPGGSQTVTPTPEGTETSLFRADGSLYAKAWDDLAGLPRQTEYYDQPGDEIMIVHASWPEANPQPPIGCERGLPFFYDLSNRWESSRLPVPWVFVSRSRPRYLNVGPTEDALREARTTWEFNRNHHCENPPVPDDTDIDFTYTGRRQTRLGRNNINSVGFGRNSRLAQCHRGTNVALGCTISWVNRSDRTFRESDTRLNRPSAWAHGSQPGRYDVESVMVHESGHTTGFSDWWDARTVMENGMTLNDTSMRRLSYFDAVSNNNAY